MSKHYDCDSSTGEAKVLLASVYYLTRRLTYAEPTLKIDRERDVRLRQLAKNTHKKLPNLPKSRHSPVDVQVCKNPVIPAKAGI
jgi:hypothetical protein